MSSWLWNPNAGWNPPMAMITGGYMTGIWLSWPQIITWFHMISLNIPLTHKKSDFSISLNISLTQQKKQNSLTAKIASSEACSTVNHLTFSIPGSLGPMAIPWHAPHHPTLFLSHSIPWKITIEIMEIPWKWPFNPIKTPWNHFKSPSNHFKSQSKHYQITIKSPLKHH